MSVRGLANSSTKQYCISYHAKVQGREHFRSVTIREKYPPTQYRAFTAARADFAQFARNQGNIVFVNVTGVAFGPCVGAAGGSGGGGGCTAPQSPVITATADPDSIFIDWPDVTGATTYIVKRSTVPGGPYTDIASNVVPSEYDDTTAVGGNTYYYVASAVNSCGTSGDSNEASATAMFSPPNVADLLVWLKADADVYNDAGVTLATNGQTVQQWIDQGGSSYVFEQTTAAQKPTFITGVKNGLPVVRFATTLPDTDRLIAGTVFSFPLPVTIFATFVLTTGNSTGKIFTATELLGANVTLQWNTLAGNETYVLGVGGSTLSTASRPNTLGTWYYMSGIAGGAGSIFRENGVQVASGTLNGGTLSGLTVGADAVAAQFGIHGDIAEIIVYGRALTGIEITDVESYLVNKWAL